MAGIARDRLMEERKAWRRDHPPAFYARPRSMPDGTMNMFMWDCGIPGPKGTLWEGGVYPVTMEFSEEYPSRPPKCQLPKGFFHPNIYPSGTVCLSILNEEEDWKPSITVKQILIGIQELLDNPNPQSPAQAEAYHVYVKDMDEYKRRVRLECQKYVPKQ